MGDYTTQLDCVRTFLLKIHTVATTEHADECGSIHKILDASNQKMFVNYPEIMGVDGVFNWKKYKIEIHETSEANLNTAINNIIIGIRKFNDRTAITDFVYASCTTMCNMRYSNSSEPEHVRGIWKCELWLEVEWSVI